MLEEGEVDASKAKTSGTKKVPQILLKDELKAITLSDAHDSVWPTSELVAKLEEAPPGEFTYVDLHKWAMPTWARMCEDDDEFDEYGDCKNMAAAHAILIGMKKPKKNELTWCQWASAYHTYALAAAATKQVAYGVLMTHFQTCVSVGANAAPHLRGSMPMKYDECCRKEWAKRVANKVEGFCIKNEVHRVNTEMLRRISNEHNNRDNDKPWQFEKYGGGKSFGKDKGKPHYDKPHYDKGGGKGHGKGGGKDKNKNKPRDHFDKNKGR